MTLIGGWAAEAERVGFESVGVIDRLMYDNLDPLTALAAGSTSRVGIALPQEGGAAVGRAWSEAGRDGRPRIVTGRYFSLGPGAVSRLAQALQPKGQTHEH
jgi:hypothetical protein